MSLARPFPGPIEGTGQLAAVAILSIGAFGVGLATDMPMLVVGAGFAPLAALFAWSQPFIVCSLFIAFSYFRLPEAYPALAGAKPALLLGTASVSLVAAKALLAPARGNTDTRLLRAACLGSLMLTVGLALPVSLVRVDGASSFDPLLIPAVMSSAAFACIVWMQLLSATSKYPLPINLKLYVAFFAFLSLSMIVSVIPSNSFNMWSNVTWKIAAMTLATSWLARSQRDLITATNIFIISGALIAAVVVYNKIYGISLVQGTRVSIGRIETDDPAALIANSGLILTDPNDLSLILLFPLAFALARITNRKSLFDASIAAAFSGLILSAIVFTQSRGAAIGVAAVMAMLTLKRFRNALPAVMILLIAAPLLFGAMDIAERASGGYAEAEEGDLDESAQHRLDAWKTAVNMAVARPVTGVGIANFQHLYYTYTDYWFNREIAVHSMWFQVLAEIGFIGLALFVAMVVTSFTVNARSLRWMAAGNAPIPLRATGIGLQSALAGTCASGTFLSQAQTWPVYVIVAMIAALAVQAQHFAPIEPAVEEH